MSLPALAIENKTVTNFVVFLLLVGGIFSYFQLGQLEDPDFTIKTGVIITPYPGATPEEVELEVMAVHPLPSWWANAPHEPATKTSLGPLAQTA